MRWIVSTALLSIGLCAASLGDDKSVAKGEKENGFVPIFDGKTLDGWIGPDEKPSPDYIVEDGKIIALREGKNNMYTRKEYSDFILRFEFKLERGANNGIGIRAPLHGDAAYVGMEIQVLDDPADVYKAQPAMKVLVDTLKPVVRITRLDEPARRIKYGVLKGKIKVAKDFDAPLTAKVLADFAGR